MGIAPAGRGKVVLLATLAGGMFGATVFHGAALVAEAVVQQQSIAAGVLGGYAISGLGLLLFHTGMGAALGMAIGLSGHHFLTRQWQHHHEQQELQRQLRQSQKLEALGRLTSGVAHDFNNLLSALNLHLHLARMHIDEGHKGRSSVDQAVRVANKAGHLPRQLLSVARPGLSESKVIDPVRLVHDMTKMLHRALGDQVVLKPDLQATPAVHADPGQLEQILLNLCVNARDAMPTGGVVYVRTRAEGRVVLLEVEDTGTGMDAEVASQIFEPFFTTKPEGHGTGLGLSTSQQIVQQHGGTLSVSSTPRVGTTFTIRLPAVDDVPEDQREDDEQIPLGQQEGLLVVDNEDEVREALALALRSHGYRVWDAQSGRSALAILEAEAGEIEAVLVDDLMPGMDGPELVREIHRLRPSLPVLMMGELAEDAPSIPVLAKPIEPSSLAREIRALLDQ